MSRIGVDEAGKGPVLGSLFAAAVAGPEGALPAGVDDSKTVPADERQRLARELRGGTALTVAVAEIPVECIDDPETDMNELTVVAHAEAIERLDCDQDDATVHCDAGDTDAERFARRVAARLDSPRRVHASHSADESDPLVGAASIIAKVAREDHVETLADQYGPVGSGYPSDPTTRTFLAEYVGEHGDLPPCARRSWKTSSDVLAAAQQSALAEFEP